MDFYMICKKYKYKTENILKKSKAKFDWHVDPIKLGSQFLRATELKDYPKMIKKLDHKVWQKFFENEARKLKDQILK